MDAPEEDLDIKLQKISSDLIADFDRSLPPFLRKSDAAGQTQVRSRVRTKEIGRLLGLLEPFQELPQLLDPQLPKWLPLLAESFLEYLQTSRRSKPVYTRTGLLTPLPAAIFTLIYTFCKIRGEKVVVRFLNNETKYLEPMLSALEESERAANNAADTEAAAASRLEESSVAWQWEERYVVLLWLSHLLLAPFDLATISSGDIDDEEPPPIPGFRWPDKLPGIALRVLPLAMKYIASAGKERDAAKTLLVRMAMRRDMQELGLLDALVQWAIASLRDRDVAATRASYFYIGILSFLGGVLNSSSDTSDMHKYLEPIFQATHGAAEAAAADPTAFTSSALTKKVMIKVIRTVVVTQLRRNASDGDGMEMIETTIGFLLENLADNDTPVRLAASKALSVITLALDADMASQVVDAVLESLNRNVLWVKDPSNPNAPRTKDLSAVNYLEWHGLMLTLSHLLYRRSPPAESLADIVQALLMGQSFERRSTSGSSLGTNVRDAACFGIWALARRYTTAELLAVPVSKTDGGEVSILQTLATGLVVTASLDPAGNIRRGSSAALQELIGRHPDTVEKGIWVVQTVDYHAVAMRTRAVQEVALGATKLAPRYGEAILEALLDWRGLGDADAAARRAAAEAFGIITHELAIESRAPIAQLSKSVQLVVQRIAKLQDRQVDERHGLLLAFGSILDALPPLLKSAADGSEESTLRDVGNFISQSILGLKTILQECESKSFRRPELVAEAASRLIVAAFPVFQAAVLGPNGDLRQSLLPGTALLSSTTSETFTKVVSAIDTAHPSGREGLQILLSSAEKNLGQWLNRPEEDATSAASQAALVYLILSPVETRERALRGWAQSIQQLQASRTTSAFGPLFALAMSYPVLPTLEASGGDGDLIQDAILRRWRSDRSVEGRVAILKALTQSSALSQEPLGFVDIVAEGLDDYTTNARGDVGSHVRVQAARATKVLWAKFDSTEAEAESNQVVASKLFLRILRLAAEKLDRVRSEAQSTLCLALNDTYSQKLKASTFSSRPYFRFLLNLGRYDWLHPSISSAAKADLDKWMEELLAGYVSSADTGNEDLVIASRAALYDFCETSQANLDAVCTALVRNLKSRQGQDRIIVPTLEIVAYLFYVGVFPRCSVVDYKNLCLQVQKSSYKTGNVRKLEACVKVYGRVAELDVGAQREQQGEASADASPLATDELRRKRAEGIAEAGKRLGALMYHPWPRIRSTVVDELWALLLAREQEGDAETLKGVDWGKADKGAIKALVEGLALG